MEVLTPATPAGVEFGVEPAAVPAKLRQAPAPRWSGKLSAYCALTKPRITFLVTLSALAGYTLGSVSAVNVTGLLHVALGVGLLVSGTSTLNQYWERALDARMPRTQGRPLPAGLIAPVKALWFGLAISLLAEIYLAYFINPLTAYWGLAAFASYLFLYTPLKTRTTWCTFIGAFPGALPPVLGWTAARNAVGVETLVLFGILFLWQFPHFHAIATLYRDDYAQAGIRMLPVVSPDGKAVAREIVGYSLALLPISLLPTLLRLSGPVYLAGALLLGVYLLRASFAAAQELTRENALRLLKASVIYLPLLWILMVLQW
ncbi:MAG: protoheme IX farnesyltransferase [Acidobacteria bacterium]|nr:protoheme IX farnesyltransferase [Acidobacteriota bacterium]MBI3422076.1 protoheme IX farnesyltransferase [Acidobacteriota bacterium]